MYRAKQRQLRRPVATQTLETALKPKNQFLYSMIAVYCVIEITLSLADSGALGPVRLRPLAYDYGAFWPGLLGNWKPNYLAQPYAMLVTYAFLHGGLVHLSVNMISLWSLGRAILKRASIGTFTFLYVASSLSGAAGFALLAPGLRPMVGTSGALFGLLGALLAWEYMDRYTVREGIEDVAKVIALLVALNLVMWWAMSGQLAWQAHLGGFLGGWIGALLLDYMARRRT